MQKNTPRDKNKLGAEYLAFDPVYLKQELQILQQKLMKFAWQINGKQSIIIPNKISQKPE